MRKLISVAIACVLFICLNVGSVAAGSWATNGASNRFALYNECRPFDFQIIAPIGGNSSESRSRELFELARTKLDAVKLFGPWRLIQGKNIWRDFVGKIVLAVSWSQDTISPYIQSEVEFEKDLKDELTGETHHMTTWKESYGPFVREISRKITYRKIRQKFAEQIDKFIEEYLRVNEAACKRRGVLK